MVKILGAGLTGLILSQYLEWEGIENEIYSTSLGGQMSSKYNFKLGPRIICKDEYSDEFFKKMNIKIEPKKFSIGYLRNGVNVSNIEIFDGWKTEYSLKTVGYNRPDILSYGNKELLGYDIYDLQLVNRLAMNKKIINKKIEKEEILDMDYITVNVNGDSNLDDSFFYKMSYDKFKEIFGYSLDKFIGVKSYLYCVDSSFTKRINIYDNYVVVETICEIDSLGKSCDSIILPKSKIIENKCFTSYEGVKLFGRFAMQNHKYNINKLIRDMEDKKWQYV